MQNRILRARTRTHFFDAWDICTIPSTDSLLGFDGSMGPPRIHTESRNEQAGNERQKRTVDFKKEYDSAQGKTIILAVRTGWAAVGCAFPCKAALHFFSFFLTLFPLRAPQHQALNHLVNQTRLPKSRIRTLAQNQIPDFFSFFISF